jgi:hypothetical protein
MAPDVCILNPSNGTHNCRPGGGLAGFESLRQHTTSRLRLPGKIHTSGQHPKAQVDIKAHRTSRLYGVSLYVTHFVKYKMVHRSAY